MASVHLARDWRDGAVDTVLALKIMREEFANDQSYVSMFLDEARILSKLDHPHLIRTIEAGVGSVHGGTLEANAEGSIAPDSEWRYIAMELLLGRPLSDLWDLLAEKRERMPIRVSATIAARVGHGLDHAHNLLDDDGKSSFELVHRDVNPSNIFLTSRGQIKLIDFGLARAKDAGRVSRGMVTGKLTYLAPEQLTTRPIDRRTDIYQLGITLWEMLTGARLFLRDSPQATVAALQKGNIPRPEDLNPRVPRDLSDIAMRALAADPDRRFTSMAGFARQLDRWVERSGLTVEDEEIVDLFERVFPDERARLEAWYQGILADTNSRRSNPPPPAKLAGASLPPEKPERAARWNWWNK